MKNMIKGLFSVVLLLKIAPGIGADVAGEHSYFLGGQGNISRLPMMGAHRDSDKMYGCFNVQVEYGQNTKRADLGKYFSLGGTDNTMRVGPRRDGDATPANATTQFYNLNLLLPGTHDSVVTFLPKIQTTAINLSGFVGLDKFMEGLHLQVDLPLVHTKTDMQLSQTANSGATTATIAGGILRNTATATTITATNTHSGGFIEAIKGRSLDGNVTTAMQYGKIDGAKSKTKIGNAVVGLGYDFMNKENMHLGVGVLGMFNGAGGSTAEFWGERAIGTAGRHGVGGRVNGHIRLYENDNAEINATLNADVLHVFDKTVRRSYDWTANGNGSRYILVKEFTADLAYNSIIYYGTNITSQQAKVGMDLLYDVSLNFCYSHGNLRADVGYQLNGHSKEKHKEWVGRIAGKKFGLLATTTAGAAGATTTAATAGDGADILITNFNDSNSITVDVSGNTGTNAVAATFSSARSYTEEDLNKNSGMAPAGLAHRVHGGLHYMWVENEFEPCVGAYGGTQLAADNKALSGWFVGFAGSICF